MPMIKRYAIARRSGFATEYYDGCETARYDGWSEFRTDADEFRTYAKAKRRADRIGGEVFSYERFSDIPDTFAVPVIVLAPSVGSRLERHFTQIAAE
ncbi:hypothetical protein FHT87_005214 [Rhizobium sp. BK316]|uniref:hypothetical protein n=1 Tax=Rhizobium sp. BK316 TaxID=2587053 RepID=UPI001621A3BD|nr:hypothetical protein [Rhizobium sp. BK316]MBB3411261.1 hypothetical protein [Rhizobium sp. BK316]